MLLCAGFGEEALMGVLHDPDTEPNREMQRLAFWERAIAGVQLAPTHQRMMDASCEALGTIIRKLFQC